MIRKEKKFMSMEKRLFLGFLTVATWMALFFPHVYLKDSTINTIDAERYALEQNVSNVKQVSDTEQQITRSDIDFIYLSDIDYLANQSRPGWGSILKDTTSAGSKIAVKVENAYYTFDKGMWAHATSTLVYDIRAYDYDYFTAYVGLNQTAAASSNGVKFYVYTSVDGKNWTLQTSENPTVLKAGMNAEFIKVNIKGANYLKLYANDNGSNGNDHAVYADAKLTNEVNENSVVPSVSEYDALIKSKYANADLTNPEYELVLLQRNLVKNMGPYAIKRFVGESNQNREAFEWLFNNLENLKLYTLGGAPEGGSYYNSLTVLSDILASHKSDFAITEVTRYGTRYGDLYKRMAFALSLTHSKLVGLWMQSNQPENKSDAVTRYELYKMLHKNDKFVVTDSIDITKWFENYTIEEMRFVMNSNLDDEEILWLNEYTQSYVDQYPNQAWKYLTPHPYMAYVWPNYSNPIFHDPEKKDYWDEKFNGIFSKYGVTYRNGLYKVWMNFRNEFGTGAVCGGISKTGSNIRAVHGIPAAVIGQPGHAAIIYYSQDASGNGYWNLDNDVSGWTLSEKGERMLLGWGNASFSRGYSVVYMALSQEVLNHYDTFEESEKLVYLADVYKDNLARQEEIYREALRVQPLNIDAWYGLIMNFNANANKTENDYWLLAKEIGESLKYFPLPMQHLTNLIKPKLTSAEYGFKFTLMQTRILTEGSQTPNNTADSYTVYQPSLTRLEANYLLGKLDKEVASFSFDGAYANKIKLASRFEMNGVRWEYSLNGKQTWKTVSSLAGEEHSVLLTQEELQSITAENDIYINIVGAPRTEENVYKIDITTATLPANLYANDLENRVIGVNTGFEWRNSVNDPWTSYAASSPDNTGNKTLQVRVAATKTVLPSEILEVHFTEDNQLDTQKYIRISHLSVHEYSTQSVDNKRPFYAENVIDGNLNTMWHTDFRYNVIQQGQKPYIIIKLDTPKYVSVLEFIQRKYKINDPDAIKNGIVSISQDGKDWVEAGRIENITDYEGTKRIEFNESIYGQYVKLELETYNMFASVAMINLFEDITKQEVIVPTAGIAYDKTTLTRENVIARLINPSTPITITNNNGSDTYVFTENNQSFTFEFVDANGIKGTATAKVDWIDKDAPTASIKYSPEKKTNKDVTASLIGLKEDVYLLDENNNKVNYVEVKNEKVRSIEYYDLQGNTTKVLYLNDKGDTERITYYYNKEDNNIILYTVTLNSLGNVVNETFENEDGEAVEPSDKDEIRKLDKMGRSKPLQYTFEANGTYSFRLEDKAGNVNIIIATVDFIDRVAPLASITYNITEKTKENVVATVVFDKTDVTVTNNSNQMTYIFKENGAFNFEYIDSAGNKGSVLASVDWIYKDADNSNDDNNNTDNDNNNNNNIGDNNNNNNDNSNNNDGNKPNNNGQNQSNSSTSTNQPTTGNITIYRPNGNITIKDNNTTNDKNDTNSTNSNSNNNNSSNNGNNSSSENQNNNQKQEEVTESIEENENIKNIFGIIGIIGIVGLIIIIFVIIKRNKKSNNESI